MDRKMRRILELSLLLFSITTGCVYEMPDDDIAIGNQKVSLILNQKHASLLASLPMKCIEREYPNKLNQVLGDANDLQTPSALHPAFYGCFDWHSAVHGQWLLVRLLKEFPEVESTEIRNTLDRLLSASNIQKELDYFKAKQNNGFERTYGWAWLLKLQGELLSWDDSLGTELSIHLQPLADFIAESYLEFLPKLNYPIRSGEHTNTAFGLSAAYDYALRTDDLALQKMIKERGIFFFQNDETASFAFEPSGYDFLSPLLEEAYLMQKILSKEEFLRWLNRFAPQLFNSRFKMEPAQVSDRKDGKLVHLDGLNLSRARCLYQIARQDKRLSHLRQIADHHLQHTLPHIIDGEYMGEHWLASFALNALLERRRG